MKYDFESRVSRKGTGAAKWEDMYSKKPDVSENVVPLSVADMEFRNAPEIIEGLKKYLDETILGYSMATPEYLDSVCNWMERRHEFEIKPEWIVNTAGVVPAFYNAIRKLTQEGDGVIIMSPVYYPFYSSIELQNRKIVDCPLKIDEERNYTIDYDLFDTLSKDPKNKVLLFSSPHNPVGRVWTVEELMKLSDIILKNDLILLSDEIHFDLIMPGYEHTVFQTISDELADKTITLTAPSKSFNLAGMGMSNVIIKNEELREKFLEGLNETSGRPFTALGFKACELAYNECEEWLEECIDVVNTNQNLIKSFFEEKHPEIKANLIEGTYLQWVDFRALNMTIEELEDFMINKAELFLDEGYIFGEAGNGFERFNLAVPTKVLAESLDRLDKALNELK